ncbi:hypothetical protein H4R19_003996 [Coemansia spiralis]|nr:hypothetical protein H4R19_003996 [Coemansia spiralis]
MDPTRLQGLVKPLLHAVLKKVHPDYFTHHPAAKAANHSAVQRLQGLLAPVLAPGAPIRDRDSACGPLEFVVRGEFEALRTVPFEFSSQHPRGRAELQAQRAREMLALCSALGATADASTVKEIEDAIGRAEQKRPAARDTNAVRRAYLARLAEAMQCYSRAKSAPDPRAAQMDAMRQSLWTPAAGGAKSGRAKLDRSKVYFAADVAPKRYTDIVAHIEKQLRELDYGSWCTLPVMVVSSWKDALRHGETRYPGFVVMPADVDASGKACFGGDQSAFRREASLHLLLTVLAGGVAFRRYLRENLDDIRCKRQAQNARHGR